MAKKLSIDEALAKTLSTGLAVIFRIDDHCYATFDRAYTIKRANKFAAWHVYDADAADGKPLSIAGTDRFYKIKIAQKALAFRYRAKANDVAPPITPPKPKTIPFQPREEQLITCHVCHGSGTHPNGDVCFCDGGLLPADYFETRSAELDRAIADAGYDPFAE